MLGQLLQETFEVDGRVLRSLRALLFKPGALTQEFSANRRADFVSPLRLYIFASLLFFFVVSLTDDSNGIYTAEVEQVEIALEVESEEAPVDLPGYLALIPEQERPIVEAIMARQDWTQSVAKGLIEEVMLLERPAENRTFQITHTPLTRILYDPVRTMDDFQDKLPIAMFFLVPGIAFLLKLLYVRNGTYFIEHLVFTLHVHAFAFIIFTCAVIVTSLVQALAPYQGLVYLLTMVYVYWALRRYYSQGRFKTVLKFGLLFLAYMMLVGPATLLVMAATFVSYT